MSIIVFSGPTIPPSTVATLIPGATCLGPASQGDVLAVTDKRVRAICLIDGKFDHEPAVTHKELLWALHNNVRVFGAASMGALRAAELAAFGMEGHGAIYQLFANGTYEDDDEVTVAHASEEHDFRSASDAMVNIRATMARAVEHGVVGSSTATTLLAHAKKLFYAERTYEAMLSRGSALPRAELNALTSWLSRHENRIDQKRIDAEELLGLVQRWCATESPPANVLLHGFPYTSAWHQLVQDTHARVTQSTTSGRVAGNEDRELLLEELQLLGSQVFESVMFPALWRALALSLAGDSHRNVDTEDLVRQMHARVQETAIDQLPDVLRLCGDYDKVLHRARLKRAYLEQRHAAVPTPSEAIDWYFTRLGVPKPDNLNEYAASVGLTSREHLLAVIAREMTFVQQM